jgi:hypothetical protein
VRARFAPFAVPAAAALLATWLMATVTMATFAFSDYDNEAKPAVDLLVAGDLAGFAGHLPAYGGSLVLRAPFALLPGLWGGGEEAVFRTLAVPCLLAAAALGVALWRPGRAGWIVLLVCVANPLTRQALDLGHPEELLGGALCAGAVLAALRDRPLLAGLLLGLALANKAWALLAVVPVLTALPAGTRVRALLVAVPVAGVLVAPMALGGSGAAAAGSAHDTGVIFQPWQLWWFLGEHGHVVRGLGGMVKEGYRAAPGWLGPIAHPTVLAAGVLAGAVFARRGRQVALPLLALVLGLRCVLDPWNTDYYALPCIFALAAWRPVLALAVTALAWVTLVQLPGLVTPDLQAAAYLAWAVPGVLWLARGCRELAAGGSDVAAAGEADGGAHAVLLEGVPEGGDRLAA